MTHYYLEHSSPPGKSLQAGTGRTPLEKVAEDLGVWCSTPWVPTAVLSFYPEEVYPHILNHSVRFSGWTDTTVSKTIPKSPVEVHLQ